MTPTPPTPPAPPPAPQRWTVSGRVTTTLAGGPVANAHVEAFIASATSDSDGRFTLTAAATPSGNQAITVSADGYRARETVIRLPRTGDLIVDLMPTAAPFSETFFNELARDARDSPGVDYPLFRWSSALKFYLKTIDENGRPLSAVCWIWSGAASGKRFTITRPARMKPSSRKGPRIDRNGSAT